MIVDVETNSLSPVVKSRDDLGNTIREHKRLLCISTLNIDTNEIRSFYGEDERQFLLDFFEYLHTNIYLEEIIGFNFDFDINFIRVRSFYHDIKMSDNFINCNSCDLRKVIFSEEYEVGILRFWGEVCGIIANSDDGSKMLELYEKKDWESIKKHSEEDVRITKAVYDRCKRVGLL